TYIAQADLTSRIKSNHQYPARMSHIRLTSGRGQHVSGYHPKTDATIAALIAQDSLETFIKIPYQNRMKLRKNHQTPTKSRRRRPQSQQTKPPKTHQTKHNINNPTRPSSLTL
ncbi:unnamed protein product, partial [Nesidiocoris tenuis]